MHPVLRLYEDVLSSAETVEFNLPPLPRFIFVAHGSATIGELAERLQAQHHGAVALVLRCERLGLVSKRPGRVDRRRVEVSLAPKGARMLERLVRLHRAELRALRRAFAIAEISAYNEDRRGAAGGARPRPRRRSVRPTAKRPRSR